MNTAIIGALAAICILGFAQMADAEKSVKDSYQVLVRKSLGMESVKDLDGATICFHAGGMAEQNIIKHFESNNISYEASTHKTKKQLQAAYIAEQCDAYIDRGNVIATFHSKLKDRNEHVVLPGFPKVDDTGDSVTESYHVIVRKLLKVDSPKNLDGATICLEAGSSVEQIIIRFFEAQNMLYEPLMHNSKKQSQAAYIAKKCDVYVDNKTSMDVFYASLKDKEKHIVLPEPIR